MENFLLAIFYTILAGLIGGGVWILFMGALGSTAYIPGAYKFFKKIDFHLKKTLKIPYPILLLIYYGSFVYLFVKFVHLLIIIAELFGFS